METSSPTPYTSTAAPKRRRRQPSHGNPEKTPCIQCGRVPHRRCEHHLCPRCCNVVVKNCPVHIRKSDIKRGAQATTVADAPRNLTEAVDVYHHELESVRQIYRWMYERKRAADVQELEQSIRRYRQNTDHLAELMNTQSPSTIAKKNRQLEIEIKTLRKANMERCGKWLNATTHASSPTVHIKEEYAQANGVSHSGQNGKDETLERPSRSVSMSITPVTLPESEWLRLLQQTADKPSIQLRPQ